MLTEPTKHSCPECGAGILEGYYYGKGKPIGVTKCRVGCFEVKVVYPNILAMASARTLKGRLR